MDTLAHDRPRADEGGEEPPAVGDLDLHPRRLPGEAAAHHHGGDAVGGEVQLARSVLELSPVALVPICCQVLALYSNTVVELPT